MNKELKKEAEQLYLEIKGLGYAENDCWLDEDEDKKMKERFMGIIDKAQDQ